MPESIIKEYELYVMPTPVTIEGKDYFDGETIFPDEFYKIQASGRDIKTFHINQDISHPESILYSYCRMNARMPSHGLTAVLNIPDSAGL